MNALRGWMLAGTLPALLWAAGPAWALEAVTEVVTEARFDRPHDVVLSPDGRLLYVADLGNDVVPVLDAETLATVGTVGRNLLSSPHDVAFDAEGQLLVADSGNDRVAIFSLSGNSGRYVGELTGGLRSPEGVVALPDGRVVVTSAGSHTVTVFAEGRVVERFGSPGTGPGQLLRPHDVDRDASGNLWVVDPGNNRIQIFGPDFKLRRTLGGSPFDFNDPKYLAFDEAGRFYVADEYNNAVKAFDAQGRRLLTITRLGDSPLNKPEGVAVSGRRLWVADTYNHRIARLRLVQ